MTNKTINRRATIQGSLALGSVALVGLPAQLWSNTLDVEMVDLQALNPYTPLKSEAQFEEMRALISPAGAIPKAMMRLVNVYKKTGEYTYGEWAMSYAFMWWRDLPAGPKRLKAAKAGQRIAQMLKKTDPRQPAAWLYDALFIGFEILSIGVLDSLHLVPQYINALAPAEKHFSDFLYNMGSLLHAKLYTKAPPFPVSVGNVKKGLRLIEKVRPIQEKHFAPWYPVYAEAVYIDTKDADKAIAILDRMWDVEPVDYMTRTLLEMSLVDASNFKRVLADGSYDQYMWDPMLESVEPMRHKNILLERPTGR